MFIKRNDFAIFNENGFVPYLSEENIELIAKEPQRFTIKSFDIEGIKLDVFNSYRTLLNQSIEDKFDNNSFIETIKPFLVFYKGLPEYSKNTKRLSPVARKIRQAIAKSKNPEETFFEDFPNALGLSLNVLQNDQSKLQNYSSILQDAIKEISCKKRPPQQPKYLFFGVVVIIFVRSCKWSLGRSKSGGV